MVGIKFSTLALAALVTVGAVGALALNSNSVRAQDADVTVASSSDNTETNMRDRDSSQLTADQAGQKMPDRVIMQKIRRAIIADGSLSTYAHNVKIISRHGEVTLKGPVRSEDEHQNILSKATDVAGDGNVVDKISIKPKTNN